jgi:flagellar assembly protein FliH
MSDHARYLFETSFDEDDEAPNPELEAAFARGLEAGMEAARTQSEQTLATAATSMVERLSSLESVRSELGARMSRQAIRIATDLVRKMMPAFAKRGGLKEIEAVLEDSLKRVLEEPRVVFRVPDSMLDALQPRIVELSGKAGYSGEVVLLADDRMAVSDCLIEWADGGAERNVERLWGEFEEILSRALDAHSNGATKHESEAPEQQTTQPAAIPDGETDGQSNLGVPSDG